MSGMLIKRPNEEKENEVHNVQDEIKQDELEDSSDGEYDDQVEPMPGQK
jgi:hypothetical protein